MWMEISFLCLLPKLVECNEEESENRRLAASNAKKWGCWLIRSRELTKIITDNILSVSADGLSSFSFLRVWIDQWGGQGSLFHTLFTILKTCNYRNQDDDISVASFVSRIGSITQRFLDSLIWKERRSYHIVRLIALSSSSVIAFSLFTYWRDFIIDTVHSQDIHTIVLFEGPCLPGSINCPSFAWTDQSKRSFSFLRSLSHQHQYHYHDSFHDPFYQSLANSSIPDG